MCYPTFKITCCEVFIVVYILRSLKQKLNTKGQPYLNPGDPSAADSLGPRGSVAHTELGAGNQTQLLIQG